MKIEIIGVGGGFSPQIGNTSFLVWENELSAILFDCGYQVFSDIQRMEREQNRMIFNKIDTVFISHHHADHSGSLANLVMYRFYTCNGMRTKLVGVDCKPYFRLMCSEEEIKKYINEEEDKRFSLIKTFHMQDAESCACLFDGKILYSGDTSSSLLLTDYASRAKIIIHEVCKEGLGVHTSIFNLRKDSCEETRKKSYLIHYYPNDYDLLLDKVNIFKFAGLLKQGQIIKI